jgi:hypothetical protein
MKGEKAYDIPDEQVPDLGEEEERFDPIFSVAGLIEDSENQIIKRVIT